MSRQARVLNDLQKLSSRAAADGFESFAGGGAPGGANYEVALFENFLVKNGRSPAEARNIAKNAASKPELAVALRSAIKVAGSNADGNGMRAAIGPEISVTPGNVISAAKLTLIVRRDTANIAAPLPFVLFGANDAADGYRRLIGSVGFSATVPAGTILTSVRYGENAGFPNTVVFTYTAPGALVDTVTVSCPTCPMPVLLQGLLTGLMEINKIRMKISNTALLAQFDEQFTDTQHSFLGPVVTNPVTPSDFQSPEQFQQGIVDLDLLWAKDNEGAFVGQIINSASFQINFSVSINRFFRNIAKGWATSGMGI